MEMVPLIVSECARKFRCEMGDGNIICSQQARSIEREIQYNQGVYVSVGKMSIQVQSDGTKKMLSVYGRIYLWPC